MCINGTFDHVIVIPEDESLQENCVNYTRVQTPGTMSLFAQPCTNSGEPFSVVRAYFCSNVGLHILFLTLFYRFI